jgi:AraC-like DNA-binding protein
MHALTHLDRKQHGTLSFPVAYYYVDGQHPQYQMPFHWHNEWEILRILDGTLQISLDHEQYAMEKGDVVLIRGGVLHGGEPENCIYECLVFDLYGIFRSFEMVKPYLRPFYRQTCLPRSYYPSEEACPMTEIAEELMAVFSGESGCPELETVAGLSRLFVWLQSSKSYEVLSSQEGPASRTDRIKPVLEYIESHYNSPLTLDDLAEIAGMNPKYFCRVFRSLTHHSPVDYLNFYRIEQAAYLLDSTDLSVTEIGNRCGFCESSYFTKVFKKYKGTTPVFYRRNLRTA